VSACVRACVCVCVRACVRVICDAATVSLHDLCLFFLSQASSRVRESVHAC
jgi:hypothetical protein